MFNHSNTWNETPVPKFRSTSGCENYYQFNPSSDSWLLRNRLSGHSSLSYTDLFQMSPAEIPLFFPQHLSTPSTPTFVPSLWHLCRHLPPRRLTATFQAGAPGFPPITEHFPHQLKAFKGLKIKFLLFFSYLAPILPSFLLWHSLQPHSSIPISNTSTHSPSPSHEVGFKSHTLHPSFSDFSSYQSLPFLHHYSSSHSVWHNSAFH